MWTEWSQKLQAIAQNGLTYSTNPFDLERYEQLQKVVAEIIANHTNQDYQKILNYITQEAGYTTPKIDVRGVVFKMDKVLLVQETSDGLWTLPGGWADILETPSGNVEREVFEESGFKVKASKLLAVYDRKKQGHLPVNPFSIYKMFFLCQIVGGFSKPNIETSAVDFFGINKLPELSRGRVTEKQIKKMYKLKDATAADFD